MLITLFNYDFQNMLKSLGRNCISNILLSNFIKSIPSFLILCFLVIRDCEPKEWTIFELYRLLLLAEHCNIKQSIMSLSVIVKQFVSGTLIHFAISQYLIENQHVSGVG